MDWAPNNQTRHRVVETEDSKNQQQFPGPDAPPTNESRQPVKEEVQDKPTEPIVIVIDDEENVPQPKLEPVADSNEHPLPPIDLAGQTHSSEQPLSNIEVYPSPDSSLIYPRRIQDEEQQQSRNESLDLPRSDMIEDSELNRIQPELLQPHLDAIDQQEKQSTDCNQNSAQDFQESLPNSCSTLPFRRKVRPKRKVAPIESEGESEDESENSSENDHTSCVAPSNSRTLDDDSFKQPPVGNISDFTSEPDTLNEAGKAQGPTCPDPPQAENTPYFDPLQVNCNLSSAEKVKLTRRRACNSSKIDAIIKKVYSLSHKSVPIPIFHPDSRLPIEPFINVEKLSDETSVYIHIFENKVLVFLKKHFDSKLYVADGANWCRNPENLKRLSEHLRSDICLTPVEFDGYVKGDPSGECAAVVISCLLMRECLVASGDLEIIYVTFPARYNTLREKHKLPKWEKMEQKIPCRFCRSLYKRTKIIVHETYCKENPNPPQTPSKNIAVSARKKTTPRSQPATIGHHTPQSSADNLITTADHGNPSCNRDKPTIFIDEDSLSNVSSVSSMFEVDIITPLDSEVPKPSIDHQDAIFLNPIPPLTEVPPSPLMSTETSHDASFEDLKEPIAGSSALDLSLNLGEKLIHPEQLPAQADAIPYSDKSVEPTSEYSGQSLEPKILISSTARNDNETSKDKTQENKRSDRVKAPEVMSEQEKAAKQRRAAEVGAGREKSGDKAKEGQAKHPSSRRSHERDSRRKSTESRSVKKPNSDSSHSKKPDSTLQDDFESVKSLKIGRKSSLTGPSEKTSTVLNSNKRTDTAPSRSRDASSNGAQVLPRTNNEHSERAHSRLNSFMVQDLGNKISSKYSRLAESPQFEKRSLHEYPAYAARNSPKRITSKSPTRSTSRQDLGLRIRDLSHGEKKTSAEDLRDYLTSYAYGYENRAEQLSGSEEVSPKQWSSISPSASTPTWDGHHGGPKKRFRHYGEYVRGGDDHVVHPTRSNPYPNCPSLRLEGNRPRDIRFHVLKNGLKFAVEFESSNKAVFIGWSTIILLEPRRVLYEYIQRTPQIRNYLKKHCLTLHDWYMDQERLLNGN